MTSSGLYSDRWARPLIVMPGAGPVSTPSADISTARRRWPACAGHDGVGLPVPTNQKFGRLVSGHPAGVSLVMRRVFLALTCAFAIGAIAPARAGGIAF